MKLILLLAAMFIANTSFNVELHSYYLGVCPVVYTNSIGVECEDQVPRLIAAKNPTEAAMIYDREVRRIEKKYNAKANRDSSVYRVWNVPPDMILRK